MPHHAADGHEALPEENGAADEEVPAEADADDLFVDGDFPPDSVLLTEDAPKDTQWRRPFEICEEPQVFVDGTSRLDVLQGDVGNCWSLAVCAALADRPELVKKVIPDGQILHGPGYTGRIIIRVWHMESWRDVEIDDRLPVVSDELIYARCHNKNEFWMPLLEKALAKFHGGYQNLNGGHLTEGFINLTGYSVRYITVEDYRKKKNKLFHLLNTEMKNKSLIACARGGTLERGLPGFHGFTVTGVSHLLTDCQRVRLLRVRNPWGDSEWSGKWRDNHDVWKELGPEIWDKMELQVRDDGESWMKLIDFVKYFDELCIASRMPSVHEEEVLPATHCKVLRSSWTEETAGGPWESNSFYNNPQFLLDIQEASPEEIGANTSGEEDCYESGEETYGKIDAPPNSCHGNSICRGEGLPVLIELLQDHNRRMTTELNTIGLHIFKVESSADNPAPADGQRWSRQELHTLNHIVAEEMGEPSSAVRHYMHLEPGARYLVVPCSGNSTLLRRFLLRVYARHGHIHLRQVSDTPPANDSRRKTSSTLQSIDAE